MRIAVITTSFPRDSDDAAGHFVAAEAMHMARGGAEVTVVAPGSGRGGPPALGGALRLLWVPDGGAFGWPGAKERIRQNPLRIVGALVFCRAAARLLRHTGPYDRIVAHWLFPSGWPIASSLPGELEVVAHGSDVQLLIRLPALLRVWLIRRLLSRGVSFRFVSAELRRVLARSSIAELENMGRVEPCRIDVSDAPTRARARLTLGLGADEVWVAIVGRLVSGKRTDVALAAATLIPGAKVVVIGDGPELGRLARQHAPVRFLGQLGRRRTLTWIAAVDVLLTASQHEGAPTVVREARALGVPVVARATGDLPAWALDDPELYLTGVNPDGA